MDLDIENYSIGELFNLIQLEQQETNINEIKQESNNLIMKFQNQDKPELVTFFKQLKEKLLNYFLENFVDEEKDGIDDWLQDEYLDNPDEIQEEKITSRANQIGFFQQDDHVVMDRNRLGINQVGDIPIIQGEINPNLKNTITRIVSLDSQFRETIFPYSNNPNSISSSTNYTCLLNDMLTNTLNLQLYSIEIPYSWYLIDEYKGNDYFLVRYKDDENKLKSISIKINEGNYTPDTIIDEINDKINENKILLNDGIIVNFSNDPKNGKTTIRNKSNKQITIIFYDNFNFLSEMKSCENKAKINSNLGWILGFRGHDVEGIPNMIYIINKDEHIVSYSLIDCYGPKYFLVMLDDFNQNHINKGLVSITLLNNNISLPSYYSADLDIECVDDDEVYIQGAPRRLTQAQLYTLNQIKSDDGIPLSSRTYAATTTDVFAVIPLKTLGLSPGQPYVEFSGSLQKNKRVYFGPVNIQNFKVRLVDDKGYTVNLHGMDWSFSIISENLYQY